MTSYSDETLLSVGMYMISRGESELQVIKMLTHFGWDEITAKNAVREIARFVPEREKPIRPSFWGLLWALIVTTLVILLFSGSVFILPDQLFWRVVTAMALATLIPAIFLSIWMYFSSKIDK